MGLAQTISEMNGIVDVVHVRDKLSAIAVYAKMCRAGWEVGAGQRRRSTDGGMVAPDDSYLYATKSYGGQLYSEMTPLPARRRRRSRSSPRRRSPTSTTRRSGDYLRKYMRTMEGVSGEDRTRIFHIIRDLFADTYGGWDKVTNQVVGGGMHFQRMATLDTFDLEPAKERARAAAGIIS